MEQTMETATTPTSRPRDESVMQRARSYVTSEARHIAEERGINTRIAERAERYGETVHVVRERLQAPDGSRIGAYLDDLATRIDRFGGCVRDGDYRGGAHEIRRFAEDHPEAFVGLAFAAGAFLGRVTREIMAQGERGDGPHIGGDGATGHPNVPPAAGSTPPPKIGPGPANAGMPRGI